MHIHNGEITIIGSWRNSATGEARHKLCATSYHEKGPLELFTQNAAEFFLWLIDERVRGRISREGK